ncbi:glycosyltransferase family 4 protein [Euzebya tangerina]|uniref:glycosyltransferase family 4 protein n=1 Tax=Euzebya tangerina TaxID=591198 RepID=UPI000E30B48F|nr:glycosyltransferase family 4 protein [Euzebya tangerina]
MTPAPLVRFISTYENPTSYYRDLIPSLAEHGFAVDVLMSRTEYRGGRGPLEEAIAHDRVSVSRVWSPARMASSPIRKVMAMITFMLGAVRRTLQGPPAAVNIFFTTPPLFALWGIVLQSLGRGTCCAMIMDIYPDVLVADGRLPHDGVMTRVLSAAARLVWRRASAVVVIGRDMEQLVLGSGAPPERVHVIRNWAHEATREAPPTESNGLREELGLTEEFVVSYVGNFGVSHTFDEVLEVAEQLCDRDDLTFVFVGEGARRPQLADAAARLRNVYLLPFQPESRLIEALRLGNVNLVTLRPEFAGLVVPSKAYGALAAGRPLLYVGPRDSELALVVTDLAVGVQTEPGHSDGLLSAVERLRDEPSMAAAMGERAAFVAREDFGVERALRSWSELLGTLAASG